MLSQHINEFVKDESGQGITEYGAVLAFVAVLVGLVFTLTKGTLASAISAAFSGVAANLNGLAGQACTLTVCS